MNDNLVVSKSNRIYDNFIKYNNSELYNEKILNKLLVIFLLDNIDNIIKNIDSLSLKGSSATFNDIHKLLISCKKYIAGDISIENLIDERCIAWKLFDNSEGNMKILLNLIIYTMYDSNAENTEPDLYESIANIILDLSRLDPNLVNCFEGILHEKFQQME